VARDSQGVWTCCQPTGAGRPNPPQQNGQSRIKYTSRRQTFFNAALVGLLALGLFVSPAISKDASPEGRSVLGSVPEFHPELGLGALQGYLDPKALPNSLALIPPPPPPGSAAFAQDEDVARATFALRDTPRFALAASDFDLKLSTLVSDFSCALNVEITQKNAPYLSTLLRRSFSDLALSTYAAKNYYQRKRPFQLNQGPMGVPEYRVQLENDPSCPSGHTAIGWGFALILSELAPDRDDELLARGRAFGESRMVVNHHWYSDVVWGRFMGAATVAKLHSNDTFRADMEAARDELAAARDKGVPPTVDCEGETAALAQGFQANDVNAIDVLLEPDDTMLQHSGANNDRLLKVFPKGFALDETHRPHITMIQRFVRTADLEKVYAVVGEVLARANVTAMKLEAFKYYYIPSKDIGLAGIVAKPTPELLKLQADLIAAVDPFTVETGDSTAFVTTPDDPIIDPFLIGYVSTFVPKASGEHFNPHVTTGVALQGDLDKMLAEPFETFTFSLSGAAVYQLGQFGTAAKKLKELDLKPQSLALAMLLPP
jgi:membrane-associated phospholipid phosphatase